MNAVAAGAIDAGTAVRSSDAATHGGEGWQARLQLRFEADAGRTRLAHRRHHGPLLVQRVFYPESTLTPALTPTAAPLSATPAAQPAQPAHAYLLHPPGGVVSGDQLQLEVEVRRGAHALLTTPAAGKYYRRAGLDVAGGLDTGASRMARMTQTLCVSGGVLEWLPQENIFYPDSAVQLSTRVRLDDGARFIGWEIGCLGLPANRATLGDGTVRQAFELWQRDEPLLLERLNIDRSCLAARWGLAGHAALGTWLAYPAGAGDLTLARAALAAINCADTMLACTLVDGVLSCRGTALRADQLKQAFIDLWRALRPALLGRAAIAPRIWAT